jgi:hypothetical protein
LPTGEEVLYGKVSMKYGLAWLRRRGELDVKV